MSMSMTRRMGMPAKASASINAVGSRHHGLSENSISNSESSAESTASGRAKMESSA